MICFITLKAVQLQKAASLVDEEMICVKSCDNNLMTESGVQVEDPVFVVAFSDVWRFYVACCAEFERLYR